MEFDPVYLGTQYQVLEYTVTLGTTMKPIVGSNPARVAILFTGGTTTGIGVSTRADATLASAFQITSNQDYLEFVFSRHGPLPGLGWYGAANVGTPLLRVLEIVYRPTGG